MPFLLSRGGKNVIAEVQRWQYFLLRQGFAQTGNIDGDFGLNTETATKFFQVKAGVPVSGKLDAKTLDAAVPLGYVVLADNYYADRGGPDFPDMPAALSSPTDAGRQANFGCFKFIQLPRASRPDEEAIVIKGSCDGSSNDWTADSITQIAVPQLQFASGFRGTVRCHVKAAPAIQALFVAWEKASLLHLIRTYDGCFVPRYKRKQAPPGSNGHGTKKSSEVSALSNHSFGSAFDINAGDNPLNQKPALSGERGSARELVAAANAAGFFWGGHYASSDGAKSKDGMHFEISKL